MIRSSWVSPCWCSQNGKAPKALTTEGASCVFFLLFNAAIGGPWSGDDVATDQCLAGTDKTRISFFLFMCFSVLDFRSRGACEQASATCSPRPSRLVMVSTTSAHGASCSLATPMPMPNTPAPAWPLPQFRCPVGGEPHL